MTLLLVPHEADARSAVLWVGAIDEPAASPQGLRLSQVGGPDVDLGSAWDATVEGGGRQVASRRVTVTGLEPRRRYRFELRRTADGAGAAPASDAIVSTLPETLPGLEDRPFTILLGSCFARQRDGGGTVGRAYTALPSDARPDLKILCGDQVYLDGFGIQTFVPTMSRDGLTKRHIGTYANAWTQDPGFRELLRDGANVFETDDHDYWNNAPNPSVTAPQTYFPGVAQRWWDVALSLADAIQPRPAGARRFQVDDLSFLVPDTRRDRSRGTDRLLDPGDLQAIEDWAATLRGPGFLVLGQLLFAGQTGWTAKLTDYGLPDFQADYARIARAVRSAPHAVVILTGDVHFGRVAVCQPVTGSEVVEVVASPLSLVAPFPPNTWHAAPPQFPAAAIPGVIGGPVTTDPGYALNANHFATVELARSGGFVRLHVRAWPVTTNGGPMQPACEFERLLA